MLSLAKSLDLLQSSYSISAPVIAVARATISCSATLVYLVTDTEYCLVHAPQFCSENTKVLADSFPDALFALVGVFIVAFGWLLVWVMMLRSPCWNKQIACSS